MILRVEGFTLEASDDNEPRIRDLDLAERLGYDRPRKIRELIKRMIDSREITGIHERPTAGRTSMPRGGEKEVATVEYWLDEDQALLTCMRSDAPRAAEVRRVMIQVFREAIRQLDAQIAKQDSAFKRVLSLFLAPKPSEWERMFPESLVRELCKLDRIAWDGGVHPRHLASTNRKIYDAIFSSPVGDEIKRRNPTPHAGSNHHQHLSPEARDYFGNQLRIVESIARGSSDKADFWIRMEREYGAGMLQLALGGVSRDLPS